MSQSTAAKPDQADEPQALLDALKVLLSNKQGVDEKQAKQLKKTAEALLQSKESKDKPADKKTDNSVTSLLDDKTRTTIEQQLSQLGDKLKAQSKQHKAAYDAAIKLLDTADAALKENTLKDAEEAVKKAVKKLKTVPDLSAARRKTIDTRLSTIQPQMRKLESWRHWGTSQARQDLIDQVKQLVGSRLEPRALAKTIDKARAQWKDWDQGGDHSPKKLWLEFDGACKEAWKPCKVYFDELKKTRKEALQQRRTIIEAISTRFEQTDWKAPDYKDIDKWLRGQRRDFFKTGSVDYKHHKKTRARFEEAMALFEDHLSRERTRCLKTREKLIEDVIALDEIEDVKQAMSQLEALKKQWVVTVIGKRGLEEKLWKRYQKACDNIYTKRNDTRKAQNTEFEQNLTAKNELIAQISNLAQLEGSELLAAKTSYNQLLRQYKDVGYVPRKHEKSVQGEFAKAKKQMEGAFKKANQAQKQQGLQAMLKQAQHCNAMEQATLAKQDDPKLAEKWVKLTAEQAASPEMQQRFEQAANADNTQIERNLAHKQALCLKLEVHYELDSPPEFAQARMAYQIERLNASMKKHQQEAPSELVQDLLCTGAVPSSETEAIEARTQIVFDRHLQS